VLAAWADKQKIPCYRGSVEDVLDRYYQAAKKAGADIVVRLTGDCPLLDPGVIDRAVSEYKKRGCDYLSTGRLTSTFPDGLDTEVFSFGILERAWKEAKIKSEREHVTPYVWKHPELFEVAAIDNDTDLSKERWTIDTAQDFGLIKKIIEWSDEHGSATDMASVMKTLASHPEWREMNSGIKRNEGYIE
jgi:spore coat polysaccharide biosynthesis protein SpsF